MKLQTAQILEGTRARPRARAIPLPTSLRATTLATAIVATLIATTCMHARAASAVATTSTVPSAPVVLGKLSSDLTPLVSAPGALPANVTWAKLDGAQVLVKVMIVATGSDPSLASLRSTILARGGSVFYNYLSVRALAAMVPASALASLTTRNDVIAIAPNRAAQRQASVLQASSDAGTLLPIPPNASAYDGRGVGIAILDSGLDFRHRNLMAADGSTRVRAVVDFVALGKSLYGDGWNKGVDYSASTKASIDGTKYVKGDKKLVPSSNAPDPYGHGTAVASVAAGAGGYQAVDSSGIAPGADLYDVRVLDDQGVGNLADVLAGIDWVLQRARLTNIRVMNLSLGAASTDSVLVDPLARAARSAVANGIVVVASAGNAGKDSLGNPVYGTVSSPGDEASVITVGAANTYGTGSRADDAMTTFSSRGPTRGALTYSDGATWNDNLIKPDLVAPGNKVIAALAADASGKTSGWDLLARAYPELTQIPGVPQTARQTLLSLSGTSIASPAVAGAAAVLLQANPGLTPPLVKAILQYSATPLPNANLLQQGTGMLNVEGAVRLAQALRTDIAPAIAAGTLKSGDNLLAAGKAMPATVSQINGTSLAWGRMAYAGGTHLVTGSALFTCYQPVWDPALTWARQYVLRQSVSYQPATTGVPANTVVSAVVERNAQAQTLLTSGVQLLDGTALSLWQGDSALTTPVATLASRADAGYKYTLGLGFSFTGIGLQADGFPLSQGYLLSGSAVLDEGLLFNAGFYVGQGLILTDGFTMDDGYALGQGFLLREGFMLNEGFMLRETLGGDAGSATDRSFLGD